MLPSSHLVVLNEEVTSLSVREEGRAQLAIVTVARNWPSLGIHKSCAKSNKRSNHELLHGRPSRIRSRAARLEPVLALPVRVERRKLTKTARVITTNAACTLYIVQGGFFNWS